ncbi:MAG: hypothetical protein H6R01_1554 [Burkholderiaceae bacterium]|nr:hypothetical protein [Burkholderiaceae bacterium]
MSASSTNESPIVNTPISGEMVEVYDDLDACSGAQWMPTSQMGFYLKFVLIVCCVSGIVSFGIYLLLQWLAR